MADAMLFLRNVFNLSFIRLGRVFSNRSGEGIFVGQRSRRRIRVPAFWLAFSPLTGRGADTLEVICKNFFAHFPEQVLLCCPMIPSKPINGSLPQGGQDEGNTNVRK
jgi:hypothetical protein